MPRRIVGVMGPGERAPDHVKAAAYELGKRFAVAGWTVLTGGRDSGVMNEALRGAKDENGLTIGILPGDDHTGMSTYVDIPIITGLGSARNNVNALTSDVLVACGEGVGTLSEVFLGIKAGKRVLLVDFDAARAETVRSYSLDQAFICSVEDAVRIAERP